MDGENNGKPYQQWMIWVVLPPIFGNTRVDVNSFGNLKCFFPEGP